MTLEIYSDSQIRSKVKQTVIVLRVEHFAIFWWQEAKFGGCRSFCLNHKGDESDWTEIQSSTHQACFYR